ncbi:outer membrane protein assembly factor BamC [Colwellia sp. BRX10-3]|uniref:outer membrane protein assembly factor BamC n=1 Tax=Colwellia sp. BRX10-3 TaxID=2759844 RepID=UPI0015F36ECC|nr:outer membrane protein assembly factor BamC [Colwellia sp. BRX10-3]MBA6391367.1 outer membrane protein assembly factor BamC [Colwellia sp. BRX10-3]
MNRKIFYFSLLSVAVASCGTINNKQAVGDFEYAQQKETSALKIPAGLARPKQVDSYFVTNEINHKGPVGGDVDVRAPSLVLPIAASTRTENTSAASKVWFDQVLDDNDLKGFVLQALEGQLATDNVELKQIDEAGLVYESDWYHKEIEAGTWPFKSIAISESIRYRYTFESKSHGRSVALVVELLEYLKTDQAGGSKRIDIIDKQRAEMNMLNEVIAQVDFQYRLKQQENRLLRANQTFVSLGENVSGEAAYIVEIDVDLLWSNLPLFFEDHGFSITDLNESTKIYYVDYVKPESSFWNSIWGESLPVVELPNGKYQFQVEKMDAKSTVTLYDDEGTGLPEATLEKIFNVMEAGLSFKDVF